MRRFVAALVAHVAPLGVRYLIPRNEPQNTAKNWVGGTADEYAAYQQAVYEAAHAADPAIAVLNGGEEILPPALRQMLRPYAAAPAYAEQSLAFVNALYADPAFCDHIDVLDVHVGDHGPIYSPQIVDDSEAAIERCDGGKPLPVWVTEVGYTSLPQLQRYPLFVAELGPAYQGGAAGQARFLTDTMTALARDPRVIGINWTFLVDPNTLTSFPDAPAALRRAYDAGAGAGLLDADYQPKPSFFAYQRISAMQGGSSR